MDSMYQWVIYENPRDYPGKFVVRKWKVVTPDPKPGEAQVCNSLPEARSKIPPGMYKLEPSLHDDPCIVEVWI